MMAEYLVMAKEDISHFGARTRRHRCCRIATVGREGWLFRILGFSAYSTRQPRNVALA